MSLVLDSIVLFYVAGFARVKDNSAQKAVFATVVSLALGHVLGNFFASILFSDLAAFFVPLIPMFFVIVLFLRLFIIKFIYGISSSTAFMVWLATAIVSLTVSFFFPLY